MEEVTHVLSYTPAHQPRHILANKNPYIHTQQCIDQDTYTHKQQFIHTHTAVHRSRHTLANNNSNIHTHEISRKVPGTFGGHATSRYPWPRQKQSSGSSQRRRRTIGLWNNLTAARRRPSNQWYRMEMAGSREMMGHATVHEVCVEHTWHVMGSGQILFMK